MSLNNIFINNLPKLDLHGYTKDETRVMVNDFINENLKKGNQFIVIVHGIGKGIVKTEVLNTLKTNKNVLDYKLGYNNIGCTVVKIDVK